MSPTEWQDMGGQFCANGDCSTCRQSEWSLATYLGRNQTDTVMKKRKVPELYNDPASDKSYHRLGDMVNSIRRRRDGRR